MIRLTLYTTLVDFSSDKFTINNTLSFEHDEDSREVWNTMEGSLPMGMIDKVRKWFDGTLHTYGLYYF